MVRNSLDHPVQPSDNQPQRVNAPAEVPLPE